MARLVIQRGEAADQQIELDQHPLRIGRAPENDLILEDPGKGVSRFHAEVRWDGQHYQLVDLGSQNGTWLNGERISTCELRLGEAVAIGPYQVRLADDDDPVAVAGEGGPEAGQSGEYHTSPDRPRGDTAETPSLAGQLPDSSVGPVPTPRERSKGTSSATSEIWRDWRVVTPLVVLLLVGVVSAWLVLRGPSQGGTVEPGPTPGPSTAGPSTPGPPPPPPPPPPAAPGAEEVARGNTLITDHKCDEAVAFAQDLERRFPGNQEAATLATQAANCRRKSTVPTGNTGNTPGSPGGSGPTKPKPDPKQARQKLIDERFFRLYKAIQEKALDVARRELEELDKEAPDYPGLEAKRSELKDLQRLEGLNGRIAQAQSAADSGDLALAHDILKGVRAEDAALAEPHIARLAPRLAVQGEEVYRRAVANHANTGLTPAVDADYRLARRLLPDGHRYLADIARQLGETKP